MAEVKWQARRVSDGVLVDVTGDISGTPQTAPTANELEAGSTGTFVASATDPGAIGAGSVWKDTSQGTGLNATWWERNSTNTSWTPLAFANVAATGATDAQAGAHVASVNGDADARLDAIATGTGIANARPEATTTSGTATVGGVATATTGDVDAGMTATTTSGAAFAYVLATRGAVTAGINCEVDGTSARMGFFGATPVAQAAANADTSGATLVQLETEVNQLKALLRAYGLLAT